MKDLSGQLRYLRKKTKTTQTQVSEIIGVDYRVYQKYEYGEVELALHRMIQLCIFFQISISYFVQNTPYRKYVVKQTTEFSERIAAIRKERRLRQQDVAKEIGVSERTYRRYEAGDTCPNIDTLCKLTAFYGVSVDYLVGLDVAE